MSETLLPLGEICEFKYGKSLPASTRDGGNFDVYGSNGVVGQHSETITSGPTIVVGRKGSIGELNFSNESCWPIDTTYYVDASSTSADLRWLYHALSGLHLTELNKSAAIPGLNRNDAYEKKLRVPSLGEQRRIAAILDKAEALRSKRREAIAKLDQLMQSVFLEMFGRSIEGNNEWGNAALSDYGNFKNGLNFEKNESGEKVKYLGVGDFKDRSRFDNISSLSEIDLNALPASDYFLKNGDLLFVRSNGNRELVGRCMEVYPENEIVTYSGFCIRYRIDSNLLISSYLVHLFRTKSVRSKLLQGGQGANIQNINQKTLSNLLIPIPPIELQNRWNDFLKKVNIQKNKLLDGNKKQNLLLISLQNNFFN